MPKTLLLRPKKVSLKLRRQHVSAQPMQSARLEVAPISTDTRIFVWQRDGGRCRHCGSTGNLQFDHVIPRSWGGSGTAENVELLCGDCNRRKGSRLHVPGASQIVDKTILR